MSSREKDPAKQAPFLLRLSGRLLLALTVVAVLTAAALGLAAYGQERAALEQEVTKKLVSVADMKEQQIETWLAERQADARLLAVNKLNQDHLTQLLDPNVPPARKEEFAGFMNNNLLGFQQARSGYTEVTMVDAEGTIIFANDPDLVGEVTMHQAALEQTLAASQGHYVQDIHRDPHTGRIVMAFGHTMHAVDLGSGEVLPEVNGAVLIVVDMAPTIYPLISSLPGLGETGETLLIRSEGNNTLFLNNVRFDDAAALNLFIPADSSRALPAHRAARGDESNLTALDYRSQEVLAVSRHIEEMSWGFVTKQDRDEAFAPIDELARRMGLVMVAVVLGAGLVSAFLSRTLTRPLAALVQATQKVSAGDLSVEIGVGRRDEIGALANSFHVMVGALKRRQKQEEVVSAILHELNASSDIVAAFPTVAGEIRAICDCESMSLGLLSEGGEVVMILAQNGPQPIIRQGTTMPLRDSAIADTVLAADVHMTPDLAREHDRPIDHALFEAGFRSRVSFPLTIEDRVIGILNLGWLQPEGYDVFVLRLLEQVAGAIALAIERSRLFAETDRRAQELATLASLSSALRAAHTVDDMLPPILEKATRVAQGVAGSVYLVEEEGLELVFRGAYPPGTQSGEWCGLSGKGIAEEVLQSGEIHISENLQPGSSRQQQPHEQGQTEKELWSKTRRSIFIPLRSEERIVGVLQIALTSSRNGVTEEHLHLLSAMADIAGNGVHRARVLETLEHRVDLRTRELAEANERLKELDFLKSKFVSEVSHELRTPVTNLKLYLELLGKSDGERRQKIEGILKQQTDRLAQLVEDILDLSRLELGGERVRFGPVDVNGVVEQVIAAHIPRAEAAGLSLNVEAQKNLPLMEGERNQLAQVITNLVANAINYTKAGSIDVRTLYDEEGGEILLEVTDTGVGIEPEDIPHLFERFYRGRLARELDAPGTGLGLGIVKEIVTLHNGKVEVESVVGQGTTFRVRLPPAAPELARRVNGDSNATA